MKNTMSLFSVCPLCLQFSTLLRIIAIGQYPARFAAGFASLQLLACFFFLLAFYIYTNHLAFWMPTIDATGTGK
jgi:hypothetical protein